MVNPRSPMPSGGDRLGLPEGGVVELRYMGFEQRYNARAYWFDGVEKDQPPRRFIITADLSIFHTHGVAIQEGPVLCARKLIADLEAKVGGEHELTAEDLVEYVRSRNLRRLKQAERRKAARRQTSPAIAWGIRLDTTSSVHHKE